MGNKVEVYENTEADLLEKPVSKGKSLADVYQILDTTDLAKVLLINIIPNNWNIIHLACWYNNHTLLAELLSSDQVSSEYINKPDINLEPPIAICCIVDSIQCLKLLDEHGAKKSFQDSDEIYRKDLNLNKLCVYHDALNCFNYLNPDLLKESEELDFLYDLAKKNGSDRIADLFDNVNPYEDLESIVEIKDEEPMENIE